MGRSSGSVGQLSEVEPEEEAPVSPGFTTGRFTRYRGEEIKPEQPVRVISLTDKLHRRFSMVNRLKSR